MKIIDIHTHFFPDNIGPRTIAHLKSHAQIEVTSYGDGTLSSLKEYMKSDGVAVSINCPVATKKEQVIHINRRMIECNKAEKDIICFGAMHQDFSQIGDMAQELEFIAKAGIKGIKLHPEYQQFYPDDPKYLPMYELCRKNNLIILFHAGVDMAYPDVRSTPQRMAELLKIKGLRMIFAHMGGYRMWDGVIKYLLGRDVYFDTAYCGEMDDDMMKRMIISHGPDKVLFGTDFPWESAKNTIAKLDRLLTGEVKELIYHKNTEKLLGI
jgi:predicted TIM-barrel fold metal-dependent hydrolase